MGFLSNLLGGKKAPAPPPGVQRSATNIEGLGDQWKGIFSQDFLPQARNAVNRYVPESLGLTRDLRDFKGEAGSHLERARGFASRFEPIINRVGDEAHLAGSPGRLNEERLRAQDSARSGIGNFLNAFRAGRSARGLGSDEISEDDIGRLGSASGGIVNDAWTRERNRGEDIRRMLLPMSLGLQDREYQAAGRIPQIQEMIAESTRRTPMGIADIYASGLPLSNAASSNYGQSAGILGQLYQMQMQKHQADNARQGAIGGNLFKLGKFGLQGFNALQGLGGGGFGGFGGGGGTNADQDYQDVFG